MIPPSAPLSTTSPPKDARPGGDWLDPRATTAPRARDRQRTALLAGVALGVLGAGVAVW